MLPEFDDKAQPGSEAMDENKKPSDDVSSAPESGTVRDDIAARSQPDLSKAKKPRLKKREEDQQPQKTGQANSDLPE